jgi:uncharacterized protein YydD (DUF2326 family)
MDLQQKIVTTMNEVVDKINKLEIMRKQVENLRKAHADDDAIVRSRKARGTAST